MEKEVEMDSEQIELVQKSFARLHPIAHTMDDIFYIRLRELDPKLYPLFKGFMGTQNAHFMHILRMLATGLVRPEMTVVITDQLGRRHLGYGMQDEQYQALCKALVRTLAQELGDEFTPEVQAAWSAAFDLLVKLTKEAASKVALAYSH
ncbi:MAG: hemin receptor [Chloroflexi bacterium]|nr:hemin receptor [Chloroflexota bacterium]